ncbi:MAG: hypothetical protein ACXVAY_16340 [Mucilaginibacter sp.]
MPVVLKVDSKHRIEVKYIASLLSALKPDTQPLWGKMKPQQMVEHLVESVEYTNGRKITTCDRPPGEAAKSKQLMIYTDAPIPKNVNLGPLPDHYLFPDLPAAINQLMIELAVFDQYFKTPGITSVHSGFGPLNHTEWVIWHDKHFAHHFIQFGLIGGY